MGASVASAFILFSLQSCQFIPYHLLDSGDVPAIRVFDEKLRREEVFSNRHFPRLTVFSPQDNQEKTYLVLCVNIQPNQGELCYHYESQPPTARLLSSAERQLFQKSLTSEQSRKAQFCKEIWHRRVIPTPFKLELGGNYFADKDHGDILWFRGKQVKPIGGWDIISVEVSPDGQYAAILSADATIRDPTFIPLPSIVMPIPPFFLSSPQRDSRTPEFRHYHQFFSLTEGTLSEPLRLPLAINGYPMHSCWSPDSKYVVYYGGRDYGGEPSPQEGGKYPDYVAIVPFEAP